MSKALRNVSVDAMGKKLSRRRLMGTASLGAAVLAGGSAASMAAGAPVGAGRVLTAQDGGTELHTSWPYTDPNSGGHFNSFVTDAILPGNNIYGDMIRSPLGLYYWDADEWLPLLATEWRFIESDATPVASGGATPVAGGSSIFEVKLRNDATWSDGTPFTAKDVVDTLWCYRIMSNSVWSYLDDAVAVDDYTVHCSMFKPSTVVERYVIRQCPPVPSSVYAEWAQKARDVFGAGKTIDDPEGAQLLEQFNQFRPALPPATGPYQIDEASISNAQMTLVKNESSVFAATTAFDRIINFNGETDTISAVALDKQIDYATQAFAPATEQEMLNNGIRIVRPPVYSGPALLMNFDKLGDVFGDKKVRQGLAHAIDGDQIGFFALAESGVPVVYNVGFSDNIIGNWLSQEAIDGLNQYTTDLDVAAQLLTEAGWSKEGDVWKTSAGEDASFELIFPAEFADWSAAGVALADQLTAFGIATEPRAITFTQQPIDVDQGNFELAIRAWGAGSSPHPHFSYVTAFLVHNTLAVNNGGSGIGFPLEQTTDAAGDVNLETLVADSALGLDPEAQKADVTVMAQVYNELLPVIPLFERYGNNVALEGVRVKEWPPEGDPILKQSGSDAIPTMMVYLGRIEPVV